MKRKPTLDALRDLLDHELQDVDGVSCGMVDDLEIRHGDDGLEILALLVGPGAWQPRLPALPRLIARRVLGHRRVRVPIAEVATIAEVITLRSRATELGLGIADRRVGGRLARWSRG
jgi:hypothetical protein